MGLRFNPSGYIKQRDLKNELNLEQRKRKNDLLKELLEDKNTYRLIFTLMGVIDYESLKSLSREETRFVKQCAMDRIILDIIKIEEVKS